MGRGIQNRYGPAKCGTVDTYVNGYNSIIIWTSIHLNLDKGHKPESPLFYFQRKQKGYSGGI